MKCLTYLTHSLILSKLKVKFRFVGTKDDFLLALAKDAHADFLITGDKDLLSLGTFKQTEILNITEFEKRIVNK